MQKIEGQFHSYDLPYMHFDVLVWYYSHHYGLVFCFIAAFSMSLEIAGRFDTGL